MLPWPFPAVATNEVGALGTVAGVTVTPEDAIDSPAELTALSVMV
jgi:hypothetical protein